MLNPSPLFLKSLLKLNPGRIIQISLGFLNLGKGMENISFLLVSMPHLDLFSADLFNDGEDVIQFIAVSASNIVDLSCAPFL